MNDSEFFVVDTTMSSLCKMTIIAIKTNLTFAKYSLHLNKDEGTVKEILSAAEELLEILEDNIHQRQTAEIIHLMKFGEKNYCAECEPDEFDEERSQPFW